MLSMALIVAWSWLAATVTTPATAAPRDAVRPLAPPAIRCPELRPRFVRPGAPARSRQLGELPPGSLELAVLREVDGCPIPAVLRPDYAAPGR